MPTLAAAGCASLALWLAMRRSRERVALPEMIEAASSRAAILLDEGGRVRLLGDRARSLLGMEGRCDPIDVDDIPIQGFAALVAATEAPVLNDARLAEPLVLFTETQRIELDADLVPLRPARGPMPAVFTFAPVPLVQFKLDDELSEQILAHDARDIAQEAPAQEAHPVAPAVDGVPLEPKRKRKTPVAGKRILLAEDGPDNQLLMSYVLLGLGADLTLVENGAEAVARSEAEEFDVVLLDLQMPVMNGFDAARRIREVRPGVVMIAISARDDAHDECGEAGFDDVLEKPLRKGAFVASVERVTAEKDALAAANVSDVSPEDEWAALLEDPEFRAMVEEFRAEMPQRLDEMRTVIRDGDWAELGNLAHRLKGAAGGFGFLDISAASGQLETSVRSDVTDTDSHRSSYARLEELVQSEVGSPA